jgi:hypothetical protein
MLISLWSTRMYLQVYKQELHKQDKTIKIVYIPF